MRPAIVIVDDDPIIRLDLREMLEEEGYRIAGEAKNGTEAIELAARLQPELVIMDVKMPAMNGIKAADVIRKLRNQDTSVLLLTAYSQKELVREARSAGVSAYLVKPVSEEHLIPAVEIVLGQREKMASLRSELQELRQSVEDRKVIERAKGALMREMSCDEEEAYRRLREASMFSREPMPHLAKRLLADGVGAWREKERNEA